jgi:RNA polymerase sigma factor (sigma-70 family)
MEPESSAASLDLTGDVRLAIAGDRQAFGRLVRATRSVVSAIALGVTRDAETCEDVVQDVFLTAWLALRRIRNPDSFLPWLRQLTRNIARTAVRSRQRANRRMLPLDIASVLEAGHLAVPGPESALEAAEERALLAAAIAALPDETRDCVILHYREGQSSERVAELLGVPATTVRKRLERARRSLRLEILGRREGGSEAAESHAAAVVATLGTPPVWGLAGGAIGAVWSLARIRQLGSRMAAGPRIVRRFVLIATSVALGLGVILPLAQPSLLWLWFITFQFINAALLFRWLPGYGVKPSTRDVWRWSGLTFLGTMAVVWATSQM